MEDYSISRKDFPPSLVELNERPSQGRTGSRNDLSVTVDSPALKPLSQDDFAYAEWRKTKPGIDLHVEVDKRFCSVPHALVGQLLALRITAITVEVMHKGKRVANHVSHGQGRYSTPTEHTPKSHQAHRGWSPGCFMHWAADTGPCTAQVVKQQLEGPPHPKHGYRPCLGLLNLGKRFDRQRLEKACERALAIRSVGYQSMNPILTQGLDRLPLEEGSNGQEALPQAHRHARGLEAIARATTDSRPALRRVPYPAGRARGAERGDPVANVPAQGRQAAGQRLLRRRRRSGPQRAGEGPSGSTRQL